MRFESHLRIIMSNIHFYPRLTKELVERAGYKTTGYSFSYIDSEGEETNLSIGKGKVASISDPLDTWSLREDGIILKNKILFEYPEALKGPDGVAPAGARLLPCILWANKGLDLAGAIRPVVRSESPSLSCDFKCPFKPGTLAGDLTLDLVLYLADSAKTIEPGEQILINEPGVTLGSIEAPLTIDLDGSYLEFPIEEFEEIDGPLWRMQFEPWDDPHEDLFSEASFTLLLNVKHPDCPKIIKGVVSNQTLLQEILAEAYFLIFEKVREDEDAWNDMKTDTGLAPDSICSTLHWFSQRSDELFDWTSPEGRMLSIKRIIDLSFKASDEDD